MHRIRSEKISSPCFYRGELCRKGQNWKGWKRASYYKHTIWIIYVLLWNFFFKKTLIDVWMIPSGFSFLFQIEIVPLTFCGNITSSVTSYESGSKSFRSLTGLTHPLWAWGPWSSQEHSAWNSNAELPDDSLTHPPVNTGETGMKLWGNICHKETQPGSVFTKDKQ